MDVKLTKVRLGWYASADGRWAVIGDGADAYVSQAAANSESIHAGQNTSAEWQVVYSPGGVLRDDPFAGTTLDWVGTLTEGREMVNRKAAQLDRAI